MTTILVLVLALNLCVIARAGGSKYFNSFDKVQLIFVHGSSPYDNTRYDLHNSSSFAHHPQFNPNRKTVLLIHGWTASCDISAFQKIIKGYIDRNDHNTLCLDWGEYSLTDLRSAVERSSKISKYVGDAMLRAFQNALGAIDVHCVGHSIGAHMCGSLGRRLTALSYGRFRFGRITGLDPAFPYYYPPIAGRPLSPNDAEFVDAIHTNILSVGTPYRVGHADFYPHNGKHQPGCQVHPLEVLNNFCSHEISMQYWTDSLAWQNLYPAKSCNSWIDYLNRRCDYNPTNFMGIDAMPYFKGVFYIELLAKRDYFMDFLNAERLKYTFEAFVTRSDVAKLLKNVF